MTRSMLLIVLAALVALVNADVYLHTPRGQNDRCDEKSNDRNNEERCYNSQNNAAGGYGICDKEMVFYVNTVVNVQWYAQHTCGNGAKLKTDPSNPENVHCNYVLQLGCDWTFAEFVGTGENYYFTDGTSLGRPGADQYNTMSANSGDDNNAADDYYNTFGDTCTETRPTTAECQTDNGGVTDAGAACLTDLSQGTGTFNSQECECSARKMQTYCYHEPEGYWLKCFTRERNKGLFVADQNPSNNQGSTADRQQPNSARYGFECPEERDYWPYWVATPWIDLAVFTSDLSQCSYYQQNSQNTNNKCECLAPAGASATAQTAAWAYNQEVPCQQAQYNWVCWGSWNWTAPDCLLSPQQPDNALGRVSTLGDNVQHYDGATLVHYNWQVPSRVIPNGQNQTRCLIRLRYNISNGEVPADYDYSDSYKVHTDPVHTYGNGSSYASPQNAMPLRMAVDTAQYGRTFQDRTWTFTIAQRPANLQGKTIHNLNVRGKRGNIAQVRNCYEYDFVPINLQANVGDYVHFQWCMTDYNDNGNAGEGRDGTDRANVVPITNYDLNIFASLNSTNTIFSTSDLSQLAWLGQSPEYCYTTQFMLSNNEDGNDPRACHFLNGVRDSNGMPTAYFSYVAKVINTGTFYFITSRNNNFSNRSNKGTIQAGNGVLSPGAIAGIVIGGVAAIGGVGAAVAFFVLKKGTLSFSNRV